MDGRVFWITGLSGVGKTTIGTRLYYRLKRDFPQAVLLDGDIIKKLFGSENPDYSPEGRKKRAFQYSELCKLLASQGITVVCCTIAMFDEVRAWNRRNINKYYEIFISADINTVMKNDAKGLYKRYKAGENAMVGVDGRAEFPKNPDVTIVNTMSGDTERYIDEILAKTEAQENRDSSYWDHYYKNGHAPTEPSDFAKFAAGYMEPNKKIIDLGCGNGRDSVYFCAQGLKVTAIDSSAGAIASISSDMPVFSVCDDFVSAKALFCVDYDYCYARWSFHAITRDRQNELLANMYNSIKPDGLVFIEARTIKDPKYGQGEKIGDDEYFFDNHYRRFLNPASFAEDIKNAGFYITYIEESDRFSVVDDDYPHLVRVIAKKPAHP